MTTTNTTPNQHFLAGKEIIVVGAGLSGLAFTYSLHKQWPSTCTSLPPSITLYERDASAVPKNRSDYSLTLHSDSASAGIQTLQKMGLLDEILVKSIKNLGNHEESSFTIWDKNFQTLLKMKNNTPPDSPVVNLLISRNDLRRTLVAAVEALPNVTLNWRMRITSVSSSTASKRKSAKIVVETSMGDREDCDVLIAADGSQSTLRSLLRPADTLRFTGTTYMCGSAPLAPHHPSGNANDSATTVSGSGVALSFLPGDSENLTWRLSYRMSRSPPQALPHPLSPQETEAVPAEAAHHGSPYGQNFKDILSATPPHTLTRSNACDKQPFAHKGSYITTTSLPSSSSLNGRTIFLAGANHAVTPFAGNGADLALADGWDLAAALVGSRGLGEALGVYDGRALRRARRAAWWGWSVERCVHARGWVMVRVWLGVVWVIGWLGWFGVI